MIHTATMTIAKLMKYQFSGNKLFFEIYEKESRVDSFSFCAGASACNESNCVVK